MQGWGNSLVLDRIATAINRTAGAVSALILLYVLGHILYEIALRHFFDSSTYVLDEFVGYAIAAMTFLSLGYALDTGSLIRVDIVLGRLGQRLRRIMELFCIVSTFGITVFCAWWVGRNVLRDWNRGAVSESVAEVPLWIPVSAVWLGLVLFALQLVVYFIRILSGGPMVHEKAED